MSDLNSPGWKRGVLIGLGVLAIILSILVFIHPGMTVATIVYLAGIILIIVGIEKIISGIFVANKSQTIIAAHRCIMIGNIYDI
jgi:uncharacterized membrane protein HdeD (DUF308 family)